MPRGNFNQLKLLFNINIFNINIQYFFSDGTPFYGVTLYTLLNKLTLDAATCFVLSW